jgi:GTPase SAR1 family protein
MILVGNKIDLEEERKVERKKAQNKANMLGIKYF